MSYAMQLLSIFTISTGLLLVGCQGENAKTPWVEYHQQLADDLSSAPIERSEIDNIGAFPEQRARLLPVEETREGMLNIYALRECQITSLIAARNNQLGRVAPPSQHWLYERELWQRLDACWNSDVPANLSPENRDRLAQLTRLKTEQLPAVSWNAIFASEEWVKSFSRASRAWDIRHPPDMNQPLAALDYLQQMVNAQFSQTWQQDSSTLENHLKTLQERPLTAEILRTLMLAAQRLQEATRYMEAIKLNADTCLSSWESSHLDNLEHNAREWLTAINQLIDTQPVPTPSAIEDYQTRWLSLQNPGAPWQQFQQARLEHAALRARLPICSHNKKT